MGTRAIFDRTFSLELIIAAVVFVVVTGALLAGIVAGRARPGRRPSRKTQHNKTEFVYVMMLAGIAAFLITNSFVQNSDEHSVKGPALEVKVTGFQWCWKFAYVGTHVQVTGVCVNGKGPTLTLPAGVPVQLSVTSADVVHEMWVPYLRFKLEAIPGYQNTFTTVLRTKGSFAGRCSEFCGLYHYAMIFQLHVVADGAFRNWLKGEEKSASRGRPLLSGATQ